MNKSEKLREAKLKITCINSKSMCCFKVNIESHLSYLELMSTL